MKEIFVELSSLFLEAALICFFGRIGVRYADKFLNFVSKLGNRKKRISGTSDPENK